MLIDYLTNYAMAALVLVSIGITAALMGFRMHAFVTARRSPVTVTTRYRWNKQTKQHERVEIGEWRP